MPLLNLPVQLMLIALNEMPVYEVWRWAGVSHFLCGLALPYLKSIFKSIDISYAVGDRCYGPPISFLGLISNHRPMKELVETVTVHQLGNEWLCGEDDTGWDYKDRKAIAKHSAFKKAGESLELQCSREARRGWEAIH
jgi:hypothetical protein